MAVKLNEMEKKIDRTCTNNCSDVCGECQIPTKKMEKKQTAVDWLIEQIGYKNEFGQTLTGLIGDSDITELLDQAKQLEKQQIVDAHKANAVVYEMDATAQAEQYYTETYEPTEPI